jgi:glutaredoxin
MYVVITRDQCNFCDQAKALLKENNKPFVEYNIQSDSSRWVLYLLKRSSITTVPQVFSSKGSHIGGYQDLKEYLESEVHQA